MLRLPGTWNHKGRAAGGESLPVQFLDFRPAVKDWTVSELVSQFGPAPVDVSGNGADAIEPAMPAGVPAELLARLEEEPSDRSTQSFSLVAACLEAGFSDGETLALALRHRPTREKYGERARGEVERSIRKLRVGLASPSPSPSRPRPQVSPSPVPSPSRGRDGDGTSSQPRPDEGTTPSSWQPIDLVARAARAPEPPEIVGLLYPGSNHLVSGESEALKTWLALIAAVDELAAGRGVLWVDGDDVGAGALLERLRLLGAEDEAIRGRFAYVLPEEPLEKPPRRGARSRTCARLPSRRPRRSQCAARPARARPGSRHRRRAVLPAHRPDPESADGGRPHRQRREGEGRARRVGDRLRAQEIESRGAPRPDNVAAARTRRIRARADRRAQGSTRDTCSGRAPASSCSRAGTGPTRGASSPTAVAARRANSGRRSSWSASAPTSSSGRSLHRGRRSRRTSKGKREFLRVAIDCLIGEGYATEFEGPHAARLVRLEQRFREDEDAS